MRHTGHLRGRVAIADREHCPVVLHGPFDEAALRRQIHHVVLVDPRRTAQQRCGVDLRRLRLVLDQLHELVAVDDLARRRRDVLAEDERGGVDLPRSAAVGPHVVDEVLGAVEYAAAPGFEGTFERRGIGRKEVRRSDRVQGETGEHARLFGSHCVDAGRIDEFHDGAVRCCVNQPQRDEERVAVPGRIAEPAVLGIQSGRHGLAVTEPLGQRLGWHLCQGDREVQPHTANVHRVSYGGADGLRQGIAELRHVGAGQG